MPSADESPMKIARIATNAVQSNLCNSVMCQELKSDLTAGGKSQATKNINNSDLNYNAKLTELKRINEEQMTCDDDLWYNDSFKESDSFVAATQELCKKVEQEEVAVKNKIQETLSDEKQHVFSKPLRRTFQLGTPIGTTEHNKLKPSVLPNSSVANNTFPTSKKQGWESSREYNVDNFIETCDGKLVAASNSSDLLYNTCHIAQQTSLMDRLSSVSDFYTNTDIFFVNSKSTDMPGDDTIASNMTKNLVNAAADNAVQPITVMDASLMDNDILATLAEHDEEMERDALSQKLGEEKNVLSHMCNGESVNQNDITTIASGAHNSQLTTEQLLDFLSFPNRELNICNIVTSYHNKSALNYGLYI